MRNDSLYYVWVDSDLIVLDLGMKLQDVVFNYSWADILICTDPEPDDIYSIVNTGFIIVKNTAFSRSFLKRWWTSHDRSSGMDQHVFSSLWQSDYNNLSQSIALLAPDDLNTKRPATINHMPYNQIIHMVGSVPEHRRFYLLFVTAGHMKPS